MPTRAPLSLLLLAAILFASSAQAGVEAFIETRQYHVPERGPRIEVNLAFMGGSLAHPVNAHGFMQAHAGVLVTLERDSTIVVFAKSEVHGPERTDSTFADFLHQEYLQVEPGSYDLVIELSDRSLPDQAPTVYRSPLVVRAPEEGVFFSDILLAERIEPAPDDAAARNGYVTVPLVSTYFPAELDRLNFYAEVYGTEARFGPEGQYALSYQIEQFENKRVFGAFKKVQRATARPVEVVIASFDIGVLPTGNYLLSLEVRDREGMLQGRTEQFFQRNNPVAYDIADMQRVQVNNTFADAVNDADTLAEFIRSMRPIGDDLERKVIDDRLKDQDLDLMKRFFYSFWYNRNGSDPESAWQSYHREVVKVNKLYGTRIKKGYETDRGQIHLKYGPPNSIMDRPNEMDAYPYQIWHYYKAGQYNNRRFVFYLPDLVSNDYELIHSDMRGEVQNPRWNQIIHSRNVPMNNVDVQPVNSESGIRADEFYEMPR